MTSRLRWSIMGLAVGFATALVPLAQQKIPLPAPAGTEATTATTPAPQEPGQLKKMVLPEAAAGPGGGAVVVTPGPEPWYTVFGTGEVVGYIEPCG